MSEFNVFFLILQATLVVQVIMLALLLSSFVVWIVAFAKRGMIKRTLRQNRAFERKFWSAKSLVELFEAEKNKADASVGNKGIFISGFSEYVSLNSSLQSQAITIDDITDAVRRKMRIALGNSMEKLEDQLNWLATIGSAAPYVGLLGTVWGIMHAFHALGQVRHATLTLVAPGISEALVATAMGLFVAIPAVIFYNRLNERVGQIEQQGDIFIENFSGLLSKQLKLGRASSGSR